MFTYFQFKEDLTEHELFLLTLRYGNQSRVHYSKIDEDDIEKFQVKTRNLTTVVILREKPFLLKLYDINSFSTGDLAELVTFLPNVQELISDWSIFSRTHWTKILSVSSEYSNLCNTWGEFTSDDWEYILMYCDEQLYDYINWEDINAKLDETQWDIIVCVKPDLSQYRK